MFPEEGVSEKLLLQVPEFICGSLMTHSHRIVISNVSKFYWVGSFSPNDSFFRMLNGYFKKS